MDEENRSHHGLPRIYENTWRAGLDRLLLGYAMPGHGARRLCRIIPYDAMEGEEAEDLGALACIQNGQALARKTGCPSENAKHVWVRPFRPDLQGRSLRNSAS